jgi:hypothetical protein
LPNANTRFNVRVNQSLPFLRFSGADWEMPDIRNMFMKLTATRRCMTRHWQCGHRNASLVVCEILETGCGPGVWEDQEASAFLT